MIKAADVLIVHSIWFVLIVIIGIYLLNKLKDDDNDEITRAIIETAKILTESEV